MRERWTARIWYLWIDGKEEGPYNAAELRADRRITPDTLVRKHDEKEWRPLREVSELEDLFEEPKPLEEGKEALEIANGSELAIDLLQDPSPFKFWLIAILAVLLYTCIYLLWR